MPGTLGRRRHQGEPGYSTFDDPAPLEVPHMLPAALSQVTPFTVLDFPEASSPLQEMTIILGHLSPFWPCLPFSSVGCGCLSGSLAGGRVVM